MNLKLLIPALLIFNAASAMDDVALSVLPKTHELKPDYETIRSLAKGSLGAMAIWKGVDLLNVTSHELGHAITAKILNKCPINITIGNHLKPIIYSGKNISLTTGVFSFISGGHARYTPALPGIKLALASAAGPLAGIAPNIALFYAANKLAEKDYDKTAAFLKFVAAAQTHHQLSNLYINDMNLPNLDGEHIANKLNFSKNMKRAWNGSVRYARSGAYIWAVFLAAQMEVCALTGTKFKDMPGLLDVLAKAKNLATAS